MVILKLENINSVNSPISINNIDIDEIVVSSKISFDKKGFKYFIRDLDLYIYIASFQKWVHIEEIWWNLMYIFFLIKDDKLLERYNEIWEKNQQ